MKHMESWHVANNANDTQGLIISESGANIAVSYDKDDAPLIAASYDLLKALEGLYWVVVEREQGNHDLDEELDAAERAIFDAKREARQ